MAERRKTPLRYMMATRAVFQDKDVSSDLPKLCVVNAEEGGNYIGTWVAGFGLGEIEFPKGTTRELTSDERKALDGRVVYMANIPQFTISTLGDEDKMVPPPMEWVTCRAIGNRCNICRRPFGELDDVCDGGHQIGYQYSKPKGR